MIHGPSGAANVHREINGSLQLHVEQGCICLIPLQHDRMLNRLRLFVLCALGSILTAGFSPGATMSDLLAGSAPGDWRPLDPENTLYVKLGSGRVVVELNPEFAPKHVENVKALAREHYYDGLSITRVQDNYVVQMGDPNAEQPDLARKINTGRKTLPPEFEWNWNPRSPFTEMPDGDVYAKKVGFSGGFPVARDPKTGKAWLIHCYGMMGSGRDNGPDTGGGTEIFVVIGQAPRHLDRNDTLFGRVVQGMELLSTLRRGPPPMGFYEDPAQRTPILRVRVAADLPESEHTALEVLRTDTPLFKRLIESRRNRSESWFYRPAGKLDICLMPVPVRSSAAK